MKQVKITCDIGNCSNLVTEDEGEGIDKEIIFVTNQNDGTLSAPYFQNLKIDLCEKCLNKALGGKAIFANGAMGNNNYWFKKD